MDHSKNLNLANIQYVCGQTKNVLIEQWADVPNYEGFYQCSNLGRIKTLFRRYSDGRNRFNPEKIISQFLNKKTGYLVFGLKKNGFRKNFTGHSLVALCFLNFTYNREAKLVVDHINGIKTDNRLSNLQIITHRENISKGKKTPTGETGIIKSKNKYYAYFGNNNKRYFLGCFNTIKEAKITREIAVKTAEIGGDFSHLVKRVENKNKYPGVAKIKNRYVGKIYRGGKMYYLGTYDTAEEANMAYVNEKTKK